MLHRSVVSCRLRPASVVVDGLFVERPQSADVVAPARTVWPLFRGKWNAALASSPQSAEPVVPDRPRIWPAFDLGRASPASRRCQTHFPPPFDEEDAA